MYHISVKIREDELGYFYKYFMVPEEIYIYIKQLEAAITHGSASIKREYPDRFWPPTGPIKKDWNHSQEYLDDLKKND